jgi:Arc/MetJ-type ribon-helix-helix transcriptional regulator
MTVTIPDAFRDFVSAQIAEGQYADESAYVAALLEKERIRKERQAIEAKLLQALDGGPPEEITPAFWEEMRERIRMKANSAEVES